MSAGLSVHFYEDSAYSRMAIGSLVYTCVLLTYAHEFAANNTSPSQKVQKREATPRNFLTELDTLAKNFSNMRPDECFEGMSSALLLGCNTTTTFQPEECDRFVHNGIWDLCQSLDDFEACDDIEFKYATEDYFRHPAFWGGCGFLIGIVLSLIAIVIGSFVCSMCCRKKTKGGIASGSGSASLEGGKASKPTSSDTKNSSDDQNGAKGAKPSVPQSQYIGDQFPAGGGKKSVFLGAQSLEKGTAKNQTVAGKVEKTVAKPVGQSVKDKKKKKKNKYGKEVGALTAMEVTMYK